jgi:hypothetical protein
MTEVQQQVIDYLEQWKAMKSTMSIASEFHYKGMEHFLLDNGQWYEPQPWAHTVPTGAPKQCFGNAMILGAWKGLRYVEGIAVAERVPFPVHHAWNLDAEGRLIDNTWLNLGAAYFGVEFSLGRADDAIWNGDSSVLDDYLRGHPLYRTPWTGEDYAREWPPSDGMKLARKALALHKSGTARRRGGS